MYVEKKHSIHTFRYYPWFQAFTGGHEMHPWQIRHRVGWVLHTRGILFSLKDEGNYAILYNTNEDVMISELNHKKTNTAWFHLYRW